MNVLLETEGIAMSVVEAEQTGSAPTSARIPMSREEFWDLPEESLYYEWCRGEAIEMIRPILHHQLALQHLAQQLRDQLPQLTIATEYAVEMPNSIRVPDIMVFTDWPLQSPVLTKAPLIAVEVLSPGTRLKDLSAKATEYAEFGVQQYWVVDLDVPSMTVHQNINGNWVVAHQLTEANPTAEVALGGYGVVHLDLSRVVHTR